MTDNEFAAWLATGGRRLALVEIDTDTPRYLSNVAYTTLPTDTPANRVYRSVVVSGFAFSESLSLSGAASVSVGTIDLHNEDGVLDAWLDEVWTNRAVRVYIGDATWPRSDFRLVFSGLIARLDSRSPQRLSIVLRDKLERINTPVTDATLGGATDNKGRLQPITLGECHNVTPLLSDPAQHEYQWHQGSAERLIEVRDNGVPVSTTSVLSTGKFKLLATPAGQVTTSVQGRTPYSNTVSGIVQALATDYGTPTERLMAADLDSAQLAEFAAACPQPVGYYISDRANALQVCQELAESVGAQVVMSREGKLRIVRLALPGTGSPVVIGPQDYEARSLQVKERTTVLAGVKLGYCKNWTVQTSLDTGIPPEHKDLYAQEWLTVTASDPAVASTYKLYAEPEQVNTLLLREADAQAEANRRLSLWKVLRTVYQIKGFAQCLLLELGQAVTLRGDRFGLQAGKTGTVIGLQLDWMAGRATVEVLV
jgi:hypothetical protein